VATPCGLLALAGLAGCVVGAPPGFSDGDTWTTPLIAPLENDVLLTPVTIKGKGPYLFMIDPDSEFSSVDQAIVSELDLYAAGGPEELSEADHRVQTFTAEIPEAQIGTLGVRNQKWRIHKVGTFWVGGRRVRGLLGRDVIADSLMFSVDRDRGVATLGKQGKIAPPSNGATISYRNFFNRKLARVQVNGKETTLHLDLGGRLSRMWPKKIKSSGAPLIPLQAKLVDELGVEQTVSGGALADVTAAGQTGNGVVFVPYADQRVEEVDLDGSLGQNFFSNFRVTANWHKKTVWLEPRSADPIASAPERLGRWSAVLGSCEVPGCVSAAVEGAALAQAAPAGQDDQDDQVGGAPAPIEPPSGARELVLRREAGAQAHRLEVLIDAIDAGGKSLGLTRLLATFMPGVAEIRAPLDASYGDAAGFAVLDVSPLGRTCTNQPCVWVQTLQY
jgi:hypothetical protein